MIKKKYLQIIKPDPNFQEDRVPWHEYEETVRNKSSKEVYQSELLGKWVFTIWLTDWESEKFKAWILATSLILEWWSHLTWNH